MNSNAHSADFKKALSDLEEFILNSEKSKSVGDMISGVTHELNNPLAVIIGRVQNSERKIKQNPQLEPLTNDIKSIMTSALRIDKIIKSLRLFAKCNLDSGLSSFKVIDILEATQILLNNTLSKKSVLLEIDNQIPETSIPCNPGKIQTALFHLLSNSMQSIKRDRGLINLSVTQSESHVYFEIKDNGQGLSKEFLPYLGQPFTYLENQKAQIRLGYYIAQTIVAEHKGVLEVISTGEDGSIFRITLPKYQ